MSEYSKINATGPLRNTLYNNTGPRPLPVLQQGVSGKQPDEFPDRAEISRKALEKIKEEEANKKQTAMHIPTWEELLNESNDRIRYGAIQLKRISSTEIPTPDILGQTLKNAVSILSAVGLSITKICQEYSHDVPSGKIIVQMPSPGGSANRQMGVAVVVSKGPFPDDEFDFIGHVTPSGYRPKPARGGIGRG